MQVANALRIQAPRKLRGERGQGRRVVDDDGVVRESWTKRGDDRFNHCIILQHQMHA